ncbi:NAD(P)-binding protein [Thozetella sp. PMI_491]|nr:NAD(P)-binding protein [Thozetella sp. PMI_491]
MSVLVVGAGELGTATLEALVKHQQRRGAQVSVLLRQETIDSNDDIKKASISHIKDLGINIEPGDFAKDPSGLVAVFQKYKTVIQCAGYGMKPGTQLGVTRAVLEAQVPHYFPWQFGVDYEAIGAGSSQPLFDEMLQVRGLLRSQNKTSWTIISAGLFMSYLFLPDFEVADLKSGRVCALGSWATRVTVTTPEDIGVMVAEATFVPEGTINQVVYIGGDTISYGQLADLVDEVLKTRVQREELTIAALKDKLAKNPEDLWTKYQIIFGEGIGIAWDYEKTLNYQRGIQLTTAKTYLENLESVFTK